MSPNPAKKRKSNTSFLIEHELEYAVKAVYDEELEVSSVYCQFCDKIGPCERKKGDNVGFYLI
jgi:hypothetical protein